MNTIDHTKIKSVYSGRKGCMCGCKGTHTYADAHRAARPSYYQDDENVSDRTVKFMAHRVERILRDGRDVAKVDTTGDWISVDMYHDRTYVLYFAD